MFHKHQNFNEGLRGIHCHRIKMKTISREEKKRYKRWFKYFVILIFIYLFLCVLFTA